MHSTPDIRRISSSSPLKPSPIGTMVGGRSGTLDESRICIMRPLASSVSTLPAKKSLPTLDLASFFCCEFVGSLCAVAVHNDNSIIREWTLFESDPPVLLRH
jgi:hypothetical protein